jgi:acetyltransferase-like isoleucine patch superfamily enzyme
MRQILQVLAGQIASANFPRFSWEGNLQVANVGSSRIEVGRYTYGHEAITIREWGEGANLRIGKFCSIADQAKFFMGGNHVLSWATTYPFGHVYADQLGVTKVAGHPTTNGDIYIGCDVWISSNVTVLSGVSVGHGAVIAANSHVTSDVGPYEIYGGNPARLIRPRFSQDVIDRLIRLRWWDLQDSQIVRMAVELMEEPNVESLDRLLERFRPDGR